MSHECAACSETRQPLLVFWDGQPYCRDCIAGIAPHAAPLVFAGENCYRECILAGKRWVAGRLLRQSGILLLMLQAVLVGPALMNRPVLLVEVLQSSGFAALAWAAGMLIFSPILFIMLRRVPMYLSLESGRFTLSTEKGAWYSWPAAGTRWHIGRTSDDPRLGQLVPKQKAIVLTIAADVAGLSFASGAVACGLTDDSFQVWLETCKLAGMVERKGLFT